MANRVRTVAEVFAEVKKNDPAHGTERRAYIISPSGTVVWKSNLGQQTNAVLRREFEVLIGGARGGSKSQALIGFMVRGDERLPPTNPLHHSYCNSRDYRGIVFRRNATDLEDFIAECEKYYGQLGAKLIGKPAYFEWPATGARIYLNHLDDERAADKAKGPSYIRIGIEELTLIPQKATYLRLLGSCRSPNPEMIPQVMSTTNPDGPGSCVPYGDVLTTSGWRDIREVRIGDDVWSVDPATGEMVIKPVEQIHASRFSGDLRVANGRGLHIVCTPNHKLLRFNTTKKDRKKLILEEIQKFPGQAVVVRAADSWRGVQPESIQVPHWERRRKKTKIQPETISVEDYASLVGWMLSEGSLVGRDNALCISQKGESGRLKIKTLLDRCQFKQNWTESGVLIYSHEWLAHFSWMGHSADKRIPDWVKGFSRPSLERLIEALMDGDGHWDTGTSGTYYTCSSRLASDFCEIALKCGYLVYAGGRMRGKGGMIEGRAVNSRLYSHEIAFHKQDVAGSELRTGNHTYDVSTETARINVTNESYDGPVYCIGVADTHTFFIRQNGCVWVSGNSWVKERFVEVYDTAGNMVPWGEPMRDPVTKLKRVFIPMKLKDNPYLEHDPTYVGALMSQEAHLRAAWLDGDWNSLAGELLPEFRPKGPREAAGEPPEANHVVPANTVALQPYWNRWIGGDWGYSHFAAFYKFCQQPGGHLYCYDEFYRKGMGAFVLGIELAKWCIPDLDGLPEHQMELYLDPNAFVKDEVRSTAEQIQGGINAVLGPGSCFVMAYSDDERAAADMGEHSAAHAAMEARYSQSAPSAAIVLSRANNDRIGGLQYIRELMRWRRILHDAKPDLDYAARLVEEKGHLAYQRYLDLFKNKPKDDVLPVLQICGPTSYGAGGGCPQLIKCLQSLIHDTRPGKNPEDAMKVEGDDPYDGFRYGAMAHRDMAVRIPKTFWVAERMEVARARYQDPAILGQIAAFQNAKYDRQFAPAGPVTFPRRGSPQHWGVQ